jgi:hypothetical protein
MAVRITTVLDITLMTRYALREVQGCSRGMVARQITLMTRYALREVRGCMEESGYRSGTAKTDVCDVSLYQWRHLSHIRIPSRSMVPRVACGVLFGRQESIEKSDI